MKTFPVYRYCLFFVYFTIKLAGMPSAKRDLLKVFLEPN